MMEVYHQKYDEIDNIPIKDILFFIQYHNAKEEYKEQLMEKERQKIKRR